MYFSEHELTSALTGTAKQLLAARRKDVRRGKVDVDEVWDGMDRYERFKILDALGTQLFPVLGALPDVKVAVGSRPSYTDKELAAAVEESLGEVGGRLRRKAVVATRVAVVKLALQQVPPKPEEPKPEDPR